VSNLLQKSEENYKTANWAVKKEFFSVAISRQYYCMFQNLLNFLITTPKEPYTLQELKDWQRSTSEFKGSHGSTFRYFNEELQKSTKIQNWEKVKAINFLKSFRALRNTSDYTNDKIEEKDWNTSRGYFEYIEKVIGLLKKELKEND
jgi:uncharacterized protein (UPF0332 family)